MENTPENLVATFNEVFPSVTPTVVSPNRVKAGLGTGFILEVVFDEGWKAQLLSGLHGPVLTRTWEKEPENFKFCLLDLRSTLRDMYRMVDSHNLFK